MAARHFFPLLREEDIGPDESKVLPTFPTLNVVRYRVGMPGDQLVSQLKDKTRVALDAPPGARKSVDMPATLLRANFGRLMVHCVPSRLLSVSLHDYVRQLHPDVTCELVTDFHTAYSFPTEGLVFVSSSVLLAYMSAWRAHGVKVDMVLYLDEVHESDFATASLRRLKNAAPGVRLYIEATATRGPGNGGSFPQPALPGSTQLYHYNRASVRHWDLYQRGTPWSLLRTDGDFLIFEDDPNEAALMCDKFSAEGLRAFRLTAKTDVESFRRTMEEVNTPSPDQGVAVLVVDYSFRSGFTFPSVTRIIDPGEVRYLAIERGRPVYYKRSAYHAELYQARNRGGRTEGRLCDYWCGEGNAQLATVLLEGVEGDLACIAQRMLGYKPDPILHASPYFSGLVPRQFEHIMCGEQALRCYKSQCEWPNANKLPPSPGTASPIDAEFPMTPRSGSLADDASVFTMDDNDKTPDQMTEEAFKRARDRSRASHVKSRPPPRLEDPPPMPQMDKDSANAFDVAFSQLSNAKTRRAVPLDFGPYYYAVGLTGESNSYPDFDQVLDDCRGISVRAFLNGLPPSVKADVIACALTTYNNSIVVGTAAQYVVSYAAGSEVIRAQVDPGGLNEWAQDVRGEFVRANGLAHTAFEFMSVARDFKFQRMKRLKDKEELAVEEMLNRLAVRMHDEEAERAYTDNLSRTPPFNPSGRYQIDIQPNGWRTRLALACLGKRPGQIDLAVSSVPNDQTVPVHSTASELAMARRSTH